MHNNAGNCSLGNIFYILPNTPKRSLISLLCVRVCVAGMTQIIRKQSSMQKVLGFWVCLFNNSLHLSGQQQQQQELHIRRLAWPGNCNSFQLTAWQVGQTTRRRCNTTRLQDARLLPQEWLHDSLYCRCCCSSSCCKPAQPCHIPGGATTRPTTMPVWIQWSGHAPLLRIR